MAIQPDTRTAEQPEGSPPRWIGRASRALREFVAANRVGLLALLGCAAVAVLWSRWLSRDKPFPVGDLPDSVGFYGVVNEQLVYSTARETITAKPLSGGPSWTLLRGNVLPPPSLAKERTAAIASGQPVYSEYDTRVTDRGLFYRTYDPRQMSNGFTGVPIPRVRASRIVHRPVSLSELAGSSPVRSPGSMTLWRQMVAPDSKAVTIAAGMNGSYYLAGDFAYWVENRSWSPIPSSVRAELRDGVLTIPDLPSCSRLYRWPLTGGSARLVLDPFPSVETGACDTGLFWFDGPIPPDGPRTLVYLNNASTEQVRFPDYHGDCFPVACGGRLWWLEPMQSGHALSGKALAQFRGRFMSSMSLGGAVLAGMDFRLRSASEDFRDVRVDGVLRAVGSLIRPSESWSPEALLFSRGGSLYVFSMGSVNSVGSDPSAPPDDRKPIIGSSVYRVTDGPRLAVKRLTTFPGAARLRYMGGDSVWGLREEERENWFDWSKEGIRTRLVTVLYRFRLPNGTL